MAKRTAAERYAARKIRQQLEARRRVEREAVFRAAEAYRREWERTVGSDRNNWALTVESRNAWVGRNRAGVV